MKNLKFSHRDLTRKIKNFITLVNGNEIVFWLNSICDDSDNKNFINAKIMFTSGVAIGKSYKIVSHTPASITVSGWGGTVPSIKDAFYIYWDIASLDASEFNNTEIVNSHFYQELPKNATSKVNIFMAGMTGVTFNYCNLDGIKVPAGNTIVDGCNRFIKNTNWKEDFICDDSGNPLEPIRLQEFIDHGVSTDPVDIPAEELEESIIITKIKESREA